MQNPFVAVKPRQSFRCKTNRKLADSLLLIVPTLAD
jgi:hypothetical protein